VEEPCIFKEELFSIVNVRTMSVVGECEAKSGSVEVLSSGVRESMRASEIGPPHVGGEGTQGNDQTGVGREHDNRGMATPPSEKQNAEDVVEKHGSLSNIVKQMKRTASRRIVGRSCVAIHKSSP